jgi:hypothetical protein
VITGHRRTTGRSENSTPRMGVGRLTRHGKPAGVLIGFESEDDWFDYRLEHDSRVLARVEPARQSLRAGRGVKLEDLDK